MCLRLSLLSSLKRFSVIDNVLDTFESDPKSCEWHRYMQEALPELKMSDIDFNRPPSDTDKLKLKVFTFADIIYRSNTFGDFAGVR